MKRIKGLALLLLAALLLAGCGPSESRAEYIGMDAAKAVALEHAGVAEADASFTAAELEERNGVAYYELDFTAGGRDYDYDVDAITGTVIESSSEAEGGLDSQAGVGTGGSTISGEIGEARAKEIALGDAGLSEDQVTFVRAHREHDHGRAVYDVEFYTSDGMEYDYEIDAQSGDVLSMDQDAEHHSSGAAGNNAGLNSGNNGGNGAGSAGGTTSADSYIGEAKAKEIALAKVPGATANDISGLKIDVDDGRTLYEGKIYYNEMEYEFGIDAYSGAVVEWDSESIYD